MNPGDVKRIAALVLGVGLACLPMQALAQVIDLKELISGGQTAASGRIIQLILLVTILSVAPGILVTLTCFTRLVIALSFLRSGIGLGSTPSSIVLVSLALFMTAFIMAPTGEKIWQEGVEPLMANKIDEREALRRSMQPLREFMTANVRDKDLRLFEDILRKRQPPSEPTAATTEVPDMRALIPAFMISELRRGFEIGFLILLPFLVIDLVVATIVMSMGMMMLSPTTISLPFKVLFFVLIDGWNLLVGGLLRSFV